MITTQKEVRKALPAAWRRKMKNTKLSADATMGWEVIFGAASQAQKNNGVIRELGVQHRERQALLSLASWLASTGHQSLADQVKAIVEAAKPFDAGWDVVAELAVDADALLSIDALIDSHIQTQRFSDTPNDRDFSA